MGATGRPVGRPAKPIEAHRLAGNPSKKQLPAAPMPGEGLNGTSSTPVPPSSLRDSGLALWHHVWTAGKQWLAPESDRTIITLLCEAQDEYDEIRFKLSSGEVDRYYVTSNGQIVTHPLVTQMGNLRTQMTAWLAAIGFSPSDRSRLGLAEVRVRDELDELQRRRVERSASAG